MGTSFRLSCALALFAAGPPPSARASNLDTADGFLAALHQSQTILEAVAFRSDFVATTGLGPEQRDARTTEGHAVLALDGDRFRHQSEWVGSSMPGTPGTSYRRADSRYDGHRVESHVLTGDMNHDGVPVERFRAPLEEQPGIKWEETWYVQWPEDPEDLEVNAPGRPFPLFGAVGHIRGYRLTDLIADLTTQSEPLDAPCETGYPKAIGRRYWGEAAEIRVWLDAAMGDRVVGFELENRGGTPEQPIATMRLILRSVAFEHVEGQWLPVRGEYTVVRPTPLGDQRQSPFDPAASAWTTVRVRVSDFNLERGREASYFQHALPEGTVLDSPWNREWIAQADGHTLKRAPETVDAVLRAIKRETRTVQQRLQD